MIPLNVYRAVNRDNWAIGGVEPPALCYLDQPDESKCFDVIGCSQMRDDSVIRIIV